MFLLFLWLTYPLIKTSLAVHIIGAKKKPYRILAWLAAGNSVHIWFNIIHAWLCRESLAATKVGGLIGQPGCVHIWFNIIHFFMHAITGQVLY